MEYQDIRFELVDHLATDIEAQTTDYDEFFKKDLMRGKFLRYMLSKKADLETQYDKLNRKKFFNDAKNIGMSVLKLLLNPKIIFAVIALYYIAYKAIQYNPKITTISLFFLHLFILIVISVYFFYEYKKIGKVKIIHSYSYLLLILYFIFGNYPNIKSVFNPDYQTNGIVIYKITGIILTLLIFYDYLVKRKQFKKQYKHLLI